MPEFGSLCESGYNIAHLPLSNTLNTQLNSKISEMLLPTTKEPGGDTASIGHPTGSRVIRSSRKCRQELTIVKITSFIRIFTYIKKTNYFSLDFSRLASVSVSYQIIRASAITVEDLRSTEHTWKYIQSQRR